MVAKNCLPVSGMHVYVVRMAIPMPVHVVVDIIMFGMRVLSYNHRLCVRRLKVR
jgi:hypothetical protein